MKIAVIGIGHVGLVTGLVFASKGYDVVCLEKQEKIREDLKKGVSHIYEPGIEKLLTACLNSGKLSVVESTESQLEDCDLVFICVNTPIGPDGINFAQLQETLQTTGKAIAQSDKYITVAIKSTVIPGTTSGLVKQTLESVSGKNCHKDFGLSANPEFLREGNGIDDFINADRIIIGADHSKAGEIMQSVYSSWECELVRVNTNTAEFIKYYSNIFLSVLISFTNEMANVAGSDQVIDYQEVIKAIISDKRLSPVLADGTRISPGLLSYLIPGPGYGGSCLPKDLEAFAYYADSKGQDSRILNAVIKTNETQALAVLDLMKTNIGDLSDKRILVLGLTHKPDTNDIRESASIRVIRLLVEEGPTMILHDPVAGEQVIDQFRDSDNVTLASDWRKALDDADIILLMTGWKEYQQLSDVELASLINGKQIVDTRYFFNESDFELSHYISF